MRNLTLQVVGIAASPGGGEVFGSRAEEELRLWFEARLNALGIDPFAYSQVVLDLLRRFNSALSPPEEESELGKGAGRRIRPKAKSSTYGEEEQRQTVMQCLKSAADDKCGIETLVDELCIKLEELEGGTSHNEKEESKKSNDESKTNLDVFASYDRLLQYYAAFPDLQLTSTKKSSPQKDKNFANSNNNKKNGINFHNNKNNSARNKKTKMSVSSFESRRLKENFKENSYGFVKSMEREREKKKELEIDKLRLAQLEAKFDSLETLWNSVPGNAQDTASIWAAPTLSIPSKPLWPTDTPKAYFTLPTSDGHATDIPNQVDELPLIPWNIDLINIEDNADECSYKYETEYNVDCSESATDGPWCWKGIDSNLATGYSHNPQTGSFLPVTSCKTPSGNEEESHSSSKVNSLPEPDEDLLTSERTHFRPIKDDGSHWADGTTFPVNNTLERVAYRRSESGNLLYLPGGESPYMEYRESDLMTSPVSTNLTLKFRVRQCDKSVQTEPIRSPVKRRILSEQDHFRYSPVESEDINIQEQGNIEKDSFALDQLGWVQTSVPLHNDRKRRHSSSFGCQPLMTLRPLTL